MMMKYIKRAGFYRRSLIPLVAGFILAFTANVWAGTTHKIGVDGLACPFCVYSIKKQLNTIEGVQSVRASIKTGTVFVTMKDGAKLSKARASDALKDAGFSLRSFE